MPGVAFPPVGSLGLSSPPSAVLCSAKTARRPSWVASLPLASPYLVCFLALCPLTGSLDSGSSCPTRGLWQTRHLRFSRLSQRDDTVSPDLPISPRRHALRSPDTPAHPCASPLRRHD